jgi:hypothetical protein
MSWPNFSTKRCLPSVLICSSLRGCVELKVRRRYSTAFRMVLMKDAGGHVIGVESLHYRPASAAGCALVETVGRGM